MRLDATYVNPISTKIMMESLQNLIDLPLNPRATFTRLKTKPKWGTVFVTLCLLSVGLGWLSMPFTEQLLFMKTGGNLTLIRTEIGPFILLSVVSGLLVVGTWCALIGGGLTIAARGFKINQSLKFRHIYAALWHTSLIRTFVILINLAFIPIFIRLEDIKTVMDIRVIPGMHMLATSVENTYLLMFLSYIEPLSVWYIWVLTIAIATLGEVNKVKACLTAVIIWLLRVCMEITYVLQLLD